MTESYVGVNDFYPFVRAELQKHDPKTFQLMERIKNTSPFKRMVGKLERIALVAT